MSIMEATEKTTAAYEPKIVAFVCKWCTYAGADLAGTSRMVYPSNVRAVMLPCTGRIDVSFPLQAFLQGADGVIVSGCHPGDCHYTAGNFRARRRWMLFRDLLDVLGFELDRLEMAWISAAEGAKWVRTVDSFTQRIRSMGAYEPMHKVADQREAELAPAAGSPIGGNGSVTSAPADPELVKAVAAALEAGRIKVAAGWVNSGTLSRPRPAWIATSEAAKELVAPNDWGNLARMLKNPEVRSVAPVGMVARAAEVMSLNVLAQEAQIQPKDVVVFAVDPDGRFLGEMDLAAASEKLVAESAKALPADRPNGFSEETLKLLDELMKKTPAERWAFWAEESAKCVKCYACRGSCPMCNCDTCFMEKNQPQWFPTAADGPGNLAWHIIRSFHLAGRCVGCGACQAACPAGIPLNVISAALARSALKHFGHRAGMDAGGIPLQSDYRMDDRESFIL